MPISDVTLALSQECVDGFKADASNLRLKSLNFRQQCRLVHERQWALKNLSELGPVCYLILGPTSEPNLAFV